MIQKLTIEIETSTDTSGDAKVLMIEQLNKIIEDIDEGREGGNHIVGDIEEEGYEIHCVWDIKEIQ